MLKIVTSNSYSSLMSLSENDFMSTPSSVLASSSSRTSSCATPTSFDQRFSLVMSPSVDGLADRVDSCRESMVSPASTLSLCIDEQMEFSPQEIVPECKDLEFREIVEAINVQTPNYTAILLPRSKKLNEVYLLQDRGVSKALFKPRPLDIGSDRRLGLAGSTSESLKNEVLASEIARKLTSRPIVPAAEITYLRVGLVPVISMVETSSSASSSDQVQELVEGTIHRFVPNSKDLKSLGVDAVKFFNTDRLETKHRTQLIAALHILTVYLDGHTENLILDADLNPFAIDFAEILASKFQKGARPPFWLQAHACSQPFSSEVLAELSQLTWDSLERVLSNFQVDSDGKINTLKLSLALLKKGIQMGLSPNQLACFIIGSRNSQIFENVFRNPSAMNLVYEACVFEGAVNEGKLDAVLTLSMQYLIKTFMVPSEPERIYSYYESVAESLKKYVAAMFLEQSSPSQI